MLSYFDASVNGKWLSDIDESIYVIDVKDQANEQTESAPRTIRSGSRFIRKNRKSLSVTISFYIAERDPEKRMDILSSVLDWCADGGRLELSYRNGQVLKVKCETLPFFASANAWTEKLFVKFTAYGFPYWVDIEPTVSPVTASGKIRPMGQYEKSPCDVTVTNNGSSTVTSLIVQVGDTTISFSGIELMAGEKLEITHDDFGVFSAKIREQSILGNRTEDSSDDLLVKGGKENNIFLYSDGSVSALFKAWGVYL